jgi:DNA-binding NtrC family response regulator
LRERSEDVALFVTHFLNQFAAELRVASPKLSAEAHKALLAYEYPGNIRELKSILERALIESGGATIQEHHLHLLNEMALTRSTALPGAAAGALVPLPLNLEQAEIELVKRALAQAEGNVSKAAHLLGINRTKVYRILAQSSAHENSP